MPVDMNDYFKKNPGSSGGSGGNGGGNGTPDFIKDFGKKAGLIYAAIAVLIIFVIAKPFVIINSGEVGIKSTFGKYDEKPLGAGFHVIMPFVQKVTVVDIKVRISNFSKSEVMKKSEGIRQQSAISIIDKRGLPVEVELTVQYSLKQETVPQAFSSIGDEWEDKIIVPNTMDVVRSVIGNFMAEELPTKRNEIAKIIEEEMTERLSHIVGKPIILQAIQLRGIILPPKITEQIERVQIAKQEEQRAKNEVERTKQEAIKKQEESRGIAEAKRIEAQGNADKALIEAKAAARANELISKSLTDNLIRLRQVEVQGKFNEALRENKDARIFLTPGGATPNIWLDTKDRKVSSSQ
ncbi:MAG: prohibitin family protein [Helicobacteraceae bacterium]